MTSCHQYWLHLRPAIFSFVVRTSSLCQIKWAFHLFLILLGPGPPLFSLGSSSEAPAPTVKLLLLRAFFFRVVGGCGSLWRAPPAQVWAGFPRTGGRKAPQLGWFPRPIGQHSVLPEGSGFRRHVPTGASVPDLFRESHRRGSTQMSLPGRRGGPGQ